MALGVGTLMFLASVVPSIISGISQAKAAKEQTKIAQQIQEQAPPVLSLEEARKQAELALNPLFDEQLERTLASLDSSNLSRGFYGQMPGDALKMARATDIERSRISQIAQLAQQMQGQSHQQALQAQQLAAQIALNAGAQRAAAWSNLGNTFTNNLLSYYDRTYEFPFGNGKWEGVPEGMTNKQALGAAAMMNWNADPIGNAISSKNQTLNQTLNLAFANSPYKLVPGQPQVRL